MRKGKEKREVEEVKEQKLNHWSSHLSPGGTQYYANATLCVFSIVVELLGMILPPISSHSRLYDNLHFIMSLPRPFYLSLGKQRR